MNDKNSIFSGEIVPVLESETSSGTNAEVPLEELGKLYSVKSEPSLEETAPDSVEIIEPEDAKYLQQLDAIIQDIEGVGASFLESSDRLVRYVKGEVPYGSSLSEEIVATEQFQTLQAACREAPESFGLLLRTRKELESSQEKGEAIKIKIKASLEHLQSIFTITMIDVKELFESVVRVNKKLANEYRKDRRAYEEEEYLNNMLSLLLSVEEELKTINYKINTHNEDLV